MQTPGSRIPPIRAATVAGDLYKPCACLRGQYAQADWALSNSSFHGGAQ